MEKAAYCGGRITLVNGKKTPASDDDDGGDDIKDGQSSDDEYNDDGYHDDGYDQGEIVSSRC